MDTRSPNGSSPQQPRSVKNHGITKPISLAGPVEADIQWNTELEKSKEGSSKREEVLGHITEGYTDQMVEEANAVIFTFGSYRLGVHGPGADIDTLCVGPSYVNREEDFFIILHDILAEMEEVTELQPVPDAYVPLMKFKFQGISIDLLYASISLLVVPDDLDISQGFVLVNVDEQTVGCRVANQILKLVPNVEFWAKRRCIYSNVRLVDIDFLFSGFFASVSCCRISRRCKLGSSSRTARMNLDFDPRKNPRDRFHHMPIITLAYPCMNSSYNVSISTLRICEEIELNKAQWDALFEPYLFFEAYKNYLQVDIVSADADDLLVWKGWVESWLRQLTLKIEQDTNGMLQCHPYPNEYVDTSKQFAHFAFFMGLQRKVGVTGQEGQQFDIRGTVDEKQLPGFVFPDGYRRPQSSRHPNQHSGKTCEVVTRSQSGLSSGLLDSEERNFEITILRARTDSTGSLTICRQPSLDVDNLPVVRNSEPAEQMGEPVLRQEFLTACEKFEDLALAYMDDLETGLSRKKKNWKGGGVGVDQEAVKLCNKTAVVETAESIVANGSENIGSSVDCESRGSLQGGGVCIADLDSLLENGHPNASDQNIPVGKVVRSQDGARSVTSQKPMVRHVLMEILFCLCKL
ncbi:hypothetical protein ES332_A06G107600v1 [Gossypium tomentosum]|uniref:polynucleotide adenylyltransferase n=1 Tax=Gossypium tomentosum TaxID=34277 RepID=A0A5D2Q2T2_GOSTO|nr:hypothetical protein ES332_A06G107600v1 [Gossypium tomentosum]